MRVHTKEHECLDAEDSRKAFSGGGSKVRRSKEKDRRWLDIRDREETAYEDGPQRRADVHDGRH